MIICEILYLRSSELCFRICENNKKLAGWFICRTWKAIIAFPANVTSIHDLNSSTRYLVILTIPENNNSTSIINHRLQYELCNMHYVSQIILSSLILVFLLP